MIALLEATLAARMVCTCHARCQLVCKQHTGDRGCAHLNLLPLGSREMAVRSEPIQDGCLHSPARAWIAVIEGHAVPTPGS